MIHLYAFVRGLRELEPGLDARPFGCLSAVIGSAEPTPVQHGLVVEGLLDCAEAVLPVRFGQRFATAEDLADAIGSRLQELEGQLDRVAGCVEVGVRIVERDEAVDTEDGAAYMRERLSRQRAADEVHRVLAEQARDSVQTNRDTGYLVARNEVDGFSLAVRKLLEAHPTLDVLCTGPWAPYSFAAAA